MLLGAGIRLPRVGSLQVDLRVRQQGLIARRCPVLVMRAVLRGSISSTCPLSAELTLLEPDAHQRLHLGFAVTVAIGVTDPAR